VGIFFDLLEGVCYEADFTGRGPQGHTLGGTAVAAPVETR
jgi:hypothetical protein